MRAISEICTQGEEDIESCSVCCFGIDLNPAAVTFDGLPRQAQSKASAHVFLSCEKGFKDLLRIKHPRLICNLNTELSTRNDGIRRKEN